MLISLYINNIAVIDEADARFGGGFNVLTGETGAGKSIIIDSINMILGERAARDLVRHGQEKAVLQALFCVPSPTVKALARDLGFTFEDDEILVTREITADGRSTCRVGTMLTTSSALRELGKYLVNIHGQHDNQMLLSAAHHISFLDSFAGKDCLDLRSAYQALYEKRAEIMKKIEALSMDETERVRKIDLLSYQAEEIEKAALRAGEDDALAEEHNIIANSERIAQGLAQAYDALYGGEQTAYDALSAAAKALDDICGFDAALSEKNESLTDMRYSIADIASGLRQHRDSLDFSPERLAEIEARQEVLFRLKRKYGGSIESVLSYYNDITLELEQIKSGEQSIAAYTEQLRQTERELGKIGNELTSVRKAAAKKLKSLVDLELCELDMQNSRFDVHIQSDDFHANGMDRLEFLISTNPGEPLKPLTKIASGGELSRIMLALKTVLAESDEVDTLIFDEIDTGVSGRAAQKIALKLCRIAKHKQVICITHLAQIASMADQHYLIEKNTKQGVSSTQVRLLDEAARADELSRIMDGVSITDTTRRHASEMLELAHRIKETLI